MRMNKNDKMLNIEAMLNASDNLTDEEWNALENVIVLSSHQNFDLHSLRECMRIALTHSEGDYDWSYREPDYLESYNAKPRASKHRFASMKSIFRRK